MASPTTLFVGSFRLIFGEIWFNDFLGSGMMPAIFMISVTGKLI